MGENVQRVIIHAILAVNSLKTISANVTYARVLCQNDLLVWFLLARTVHLREDKPSKLVTQFLQNANWNAAKTLLVLEFPLEKVKLLIGTDASSSTKETPSQLILGMTETLTLGGRTMTALKLLASRRNALIVPNADSTKILDGPSEILHLVFIRNVCVLLEM